jgi:hypothetical protein
MNRKEQIVYILGFIIIICGAFAGRDFSNSGDVLEGVGLIVLFLGIFLIFLYNSKHSLGDWSPFKVGGG